MTTERDPQTRLVLSWLREDARENAERVLLRALDEVDTTPQRRSWWPAWRTNRMKTLANPAAAAAVLAVAIVGYQFLPKGFGPGGTSPAADLPVGPHVMVSTVGGNSCLAGQSVGAPCEDRVRVTIPAPGWFAEPDEASVSKDLGGDDHVTVVTVPGDHYYVPENICKWQAASDLVYPREPVGGLRAHELIRYLGRQTYDTPEGSLTRDLSAAVDVTPDGVLGERLSVTGAVPDIDPNGCDGQRFCSLLDQDGAECLLPHLEPNALVTFWISDHADRNLWVVAATYWPTTGSELRAEMNAIVDSMD